MADFNELARRLDRIEAMLGRIPGGGVSDPPPDPWGGWMPKFRWPTPFPFPFPTPGDPAPIDLSRFNRMQLNMAKEMLKAERFRLDAMEQLIDAQMKMAGD